MFKNIVDKGNYFNKILILTFPRKYSVMFLKKSLPCDFSLVHDLLYFVLKTFVRKDEETHNVLEVGIFTQGPTHFQKPFSIPFEYIFNTNEKTLMPSLIFIFRKFYSWNTMQKTAAKLSSAVKNKIWKKQMDEFGIFILFQYFCTFWPNSILFQGLENRFHNSILFQYCTAREPFSHLLCLNWWWETEIVISASSHSWQRFMWGYNKS